MGIFSKRKKEEEKEYDSVIVGNGWAKETKKGDDFVSISINMGKLKDLVESCDEDLEYLQLFMWVSRDKDKSDFFLTGNKEQNNEKKKK